MNQRKALSNAHLAEIVRQKERDLVKQNKQDRRSQRTRQMVLSAMSELLREKRYEAITVRDILHRADIGSSTFYTHFFDKEDVQASLMEHMLDQLIQPSARSEASDQEILPSLQLFRHFQEHAQQLQIFSRGRRESILWEMIEITLSRSIEQTLLSRSAKKYPLAAPPAAIAHYLAGAFLSLLRWWLDADMSFSPEQMTEIFQRLVLPDRWAEGMRLT